MLEGLIRARYTRDKLSQLESLNSNLDILRHQTRLLLDFNLIKTERYEYAGQLLNSIGTDLGGWIRQQHQRLKHTMNRYGYLWDQVIAFENLLLAARQAQKGKTVSG